MPVLNLLRHGTIATFIGALALAACQNAPAPTHVTPTVGTGGPETRPSNPNTPTALPQATALPTPLPSATPGPRAFTIALAAPPGSLDPANATDEASLIITRHVYEGLVQYAPGETRVEAALAETWEVSDDGLTWTFHLREGVTFANGAPLTANSVAQNFARWLNRTPPGDYAYWRIIFGGFAGQADENGAPLTLIASVTTPDADTLVLVLTRPNAALLNTLAMPSFAIVHPNAWASPLFGRPLNASAGTGPFALQSWKTPEIVVLARNPNYWGRAPAPDELVFKAIPDDTQRLIALQVGEVDGLTRLNPSDYERVAQWPEIRVDFDPPLGVLYLGFNQARAPWGNLDCRLAVALALDRARYVQEFFPGDASVADSMQSPAVWGYAPSPARERDLAQAQSHLQQCRADAGVTWPETITLYVPPIPRDYIPTPTELGQAMQADLASAGITVTIASPDWQTEYLPDVQAGRADLFLLGWYSLNGDPDGALCPLFCGDNASFNTDRQGHPIPPDAELAQLLQSAQALTDAAERERLYAQAQARIYEAVPAVPLALRQTAWAFRADLRGHLPSPIEAVFFELSDG
jgi:peptide/nickel transport system substrate-binding protein